MLSFSNIFGEIFFNFCFAVLPIMLIGGLFLLLIIKFSKNDKATQQGTKSPESKSAISTPPDRLD